MKKNRSILLVIALIISLLFTTTVYSAFNTQLQIRGDAVVRSEQTFRITALKLLEATNDAFETYTSKYDKFTTTIYATLPEGSSMTYEVEITNKNTELIYRLEEILDLINDNNNVEIEYGINVGDCITDNTVKKFTVKLTNNTSTEQVIKLITQYNFKTVNWMPLETKFLSESNTCDFNQNREGCIFEVEVTNPNPFNVNYKLTSSNFLYTIIDEKTHTDSLEIGGSTTVTHEVHVKLRPNVPYDHEQVNIMLQIHTTSPLSSTADIGSILLILPKYGTITILDSREILDSPSNFTDIEATDGFLYKITEMNDLSYTYYFRGVIENNYFQFADRLWRVVRIDSSGNIRLVLQENIYGTKFTNNYVMGEVENLEAAIPLLDYKQSNVKSVVEDWYKQNIETNDESQYVADSKFCVDLSYQDPFTTQFNRYVYYFTPYIHVGVDTQNFTPDFSCSEENTLTSNVGLLTAEEVLAAGAYWERENNKYYLYDPVYSDVEQTSWTLSASYYSIHEKQAGVIVYNQGARGLFDWTGGGNLSATYGYRPVVSIKGNVKLKGMGTIDDPYQILGAEAAPINLLN